MDKTWLVLLALTSFCAATPAVNQITKNDFHDTIHPVAFRLNTANEATRFIADQDIVYYLFTRGNSDIGGMLLLGDEVLLAATRFDPSKRTVLLLHGWRGRAESESNLVLKSAFLAADDVNVIIADWSAGADTNYLAAVRNTAIAGESVARFVNWLNYRVGSTAAQFHIVGQHMGGHMAGVVGRNVDGVIPYITALDPPLFGFMSTADQLWLADAEYIEAVHTNIGEGGYILPLGHVDFYPNGGMVMPGCADASCSHDRSFHYMAESVVAGGFTGSECATYLNAVLGMCTMSGRLNMGGLTPKTGTTGVYHFNTNADSPYSQG